MPSRLVSSTTKTKSKPNSTTFGPLPAFRTTVPAHAFHRVGVDFAGPMKTILSTSSCKGKQVTKYEYHYVLVITCLNSRGIFLQLLDSATHESTSLGLRKLSSIYGEPELVYSDNANYFVKASTAIKELYDTLPGALETLRWKFSTPGSPESNGMTEAMVGMMKKHLKAKTFDRTVTRQELESYLCEVTALINRRPLFRVGTEVITPYHLIFGRSLSTLPFPTTTLKSSTSVQTHIRIRKHLSLFWNEWRIQYFHQLKHQQVKRQECSLRVGDRILYEPFNVNSRFNWRTGRVLELLNSKDGQPRLATIQLDDNKEILTRRPITKLVTLPRAEDVVARSGQTVSWCLARWRTPFVFICWRPRRFLSFLLSLVFRTKIVTSWTESIFSSFFTQFIIQLHFTSITLSSLNFFDCVPTSWFSLISCIYSCYSLLILKLFKSLPTFGATQTLSDLELTLSSPLVPPSGNWR